MVTNLRYFGMYHVGVSATENIAIADSVSGKETVVSIKDIPFLRFRLGEYGEEQVGFIKRTMEEFKYSTAIVEVNDNGVDGDIENLRELSGTAAMFYYVDLSEEEYKSIISGGTLNVSNKLAMALKEPNFERLILVDKTSTLDMIWLNTMIKSVAKQLGIKESGIGMCESPMCLSADRCCLNAVQAREIAAKYNFNTDVALSSANHQSMSQCSCIRHYDVVCDILAPVKKEKKAVKGNSKAEREDGDTVRAPKKPVIKKRYTYQNYI